MKKQKHFVNRHFYLREIILCCAFGLILTPAHADPTCDAEVTTIQAELEAPANKTISQSDFEKALHLFKILSEDCDGGTPFEVVEPIVQQIRSLLGMEVYHEN